VVPETSRGCSIRPAAAACPSGAGVVTATISPRYHKLRGEGRSPGSGDPDEPPRGFSP
jgi:hypothetical protein